MRKILALLIIALELLAISTTPTYAEITNTVDELLKNKRTVAYMYTPAMQESLYRLGLEQDKKLGLQQECKSQYRVEPYSVAVLQPIDYPEDKQHPVKGIWNFRYQFQRCGESKFYNAIFIASENENTQPTPRAYFPGTTNASPRLVKDAMLGALTSAMFKTGQKNCKDIDVFDMRVVQPAHDVTNKGKTFKSIWNEIWTFNLCGKVAEIGVSFIPDSTGSGTTYVIDSNISNEAINRK